MSNIYVSTIGVPRKPRNKRIYGGNSFVFTNVSSGGVTDGRHFEIGTIKDLTSSSVELFFTEDFTLKPTVINLKVYKMVEMETGKYIVQDVLHYHTSEDWVTISGFTLEIDPSENLTGIIIEYAFA